MPQPACAVQVCASLYWKQLAGSLPPLETTPTGAPPPEQVQSHGAQLASGPQSGQAQAHVPGSLQPGPPSLQSQAHGGHISPGAQGGHAQLHAPPPPPPEQSHSTFGHSAPAGQATGLTQAQSPPPSSLAWQKPPPEHAAPMGQSNATDDHAQPLSARHAASSRARHGSLLTHAPSATGAAQSTAHLAPSGQGAHGCVCATSAQRHPRAVARQLD